jgi:hypothetical protein
MTEKRPTLTIVPAQPGWFVSPGYEEELIFEPVIAWEIETGDMPTTLCGQFRQTVPSIAIGARCSNGRTCWSCAKKSLRVRRMWRSRSQN